jgi:hypothetical protein
MIYLINLIVCCAVYPGIYSVTRIDYAAFSCMKIAKNVVILDNCDDKDSGVSVMKSPNSIVAESSSVSLSRVGLKVDGDRDYCITGSAVCPIIKSIYEPLGVSKCVVSSFDDGIPVGDRYDFELRPPVRVYCDRFANIPKIDSNRKGLMGRYCLQYLGRWTRRPIRGWDFGFNHRNAVEYKIGALIQFRRPRAPVQGFALQPGSYLGR